jgi:prepilin-type N-terminal cleavage/methylation domain-containing protein
VLKRPPVRRADGGFTLIELLISIAILGIITLPIGNLIINYLQSTSQTTARLSESHDAQTAAAYFAQDVASIGSRSGTFVTAQAPFPLEWSVNNPTYPCTRSGTTQVISFVWDEYDDASGTGQLIRVAYVTATVGTEHQLIRLHCSGSSTPDAAAVMAHDVDPGTTPTATCSSTCTAFPAVPLTITLTMSILDPTNTGPALPLTLVGTRRQT